MTQQFVKIRAIGMADRATESVAELEWCDMPFGSAVLEGDWDYLWYGQDCDVLDGRVFPVVAEHLALEKPDLLIVSSPQARFLSGVYERPETCFQILCEIGKKGKLYAFGNKFMSRALFAHSCVATGARFLSSLLRHTERLSVLSHPWIEVKESMHPDDDDFFAWIENNSDI